ncbi:MAG: Uncharacterised protein [Synechococcus sp. CC9902]|nr:MAG: Uncharacterised protein [Synechococcus sp. CC9902]
MPLPSFGGEKPLEAEAGAGQSTAHQRRGGGTGAGDADHRITRGTRGSRKVLPRVADARQPGIADHRQAVAFRQQLQQLGQPGSGVVLMKGDLPAPRLQVAEQHPAVTGVLTGDHIHRSEQGFGAGREIPEIADRCSHQVQMARRRLIPLHHNGQRLNRF